YYQCIPNVLFKHVISAWHSQRVLSTIRGCRYLLPSSSPEEGSTRPRALSSPSLFIHNTHTHTHTHTIQTCTPTYAHNADRYTQILYLDLVIYQTHFYPRFITNQI